jgi:hypothetical protein
LQKVEANKSKEQKKKKMSADERFDARLYRAICHSFFIVKDKTEINWRRPYVQSSQVKCSVRIMNKPFSEGAMRYAFLARDITYK